MSTYRTPKKCGLANSSFGSPSNSSLENGTDYVNRNNMMGFQIPRPICRELDNQVESELDSGNLTPSNASASKNLNIAKASKNFHISKSPKTLDISASSQTLDISASSQTMDFTKSLKPSDISIASNSKTMDNSKPLKVLDNSYTWDIHNSNSKASQIVGETRNSKVSRESKALKASKESKELKADAPTNSNSNLPEVVSKRRVSLKWKKMGELDDELAMKGELVM